MYKVFSFVVKPLINFQHSSFPVRLKHLKGDSGVCAVYPLYSQLFISSVGFRWYQLFPLKVVSGVNVHLADYLPPPLSPPTPPHHQSPCSQSSKPWSFNKTCMFITIRCIFVSFLKDSNENLFPRSKTSMFWLRTWALRYTVDERTLISKVFYLEYS